MAASAVGGIVKVCKAVKEAKAITAVAHLGQLQKLAVHGNSLSSMRPTWGYKLYSTSGQFLKNGITSKAVAETRYSQTIRKATYMVKQQFPQSSIGL